MDIPTVPGSLYTVATKTTCDITDTATGTPIDSVSSGSVTFTAQGTVTTLSDPDATYSKVNFKNAAAALRMLGGGEQYPGFDIMKYAACTNMADMQAVNPNYKTDLTECGAWVYELPELKTTDNLFANSPLTKFVPRTLPKVTHTYFTFSGCANLKTWNTTFKVAWGLNRAFYNSGLETFDLNGGAVAATNLDLAFGDCKKMRVFNAKLTGKITTAINTFSLCQLDKDSVLRIADAKPSTSGVRITLGIHADLENDEEVANALETMEAAGWSLTVQWNGTKTAGSSVARWNMRPSPVYAKLSDVSTLEQPETTVLEWGHYVTNAEENGFSEYASVQAAETELLNH